MKKVRCLNGHFFDSDTYDKCPLCNSVKVEENDANGVESAKSVTQEKKHLFPWMKDNKKAAEIVRVEDGAVDKTFSIFGNDNDKSKPINEIYSCAAAKPATDAAGADSHSDKKVEDASVKKSEPPAAFEESRNSVAVSIKDEIKNARLDSNKTIGFFSMPVPKTQEDGTASTNIPATQNEPLVGWIVCLKVVNFGKGFSLFSGMNSVGRSEENRIVIPGDNGISRQKHAMIVYEPKKRVFYIKSGESSGLTYVNDEIVMETKQLEAWDKITLGDSDFLLIPLCCDRFSWEDYITR